MKKKNTSKCKKVEKEIKLPIFGVNVKIIVSPVEYDDDIDEDYDIDTLQYVSDKIELAISHWHSGELTEMELEAVETISEGNYEW